MKKAILVALVAMVASSASAALLLYEGFDYAAPDPAPKNMYNDNSLAGKNGGTGWTGAWSATWDASQAFGITAANPLSYGALLTSGNQAVSSLTSASGSPADDAGRSYGALSSADGSKYWISYLVQWGDLAEAAAGWRWGGMKLHNGQDLWFGKNAGSANFGMELPGASNSSTPILANTTYLVVGLVEYAGGLMNKHLWINPGVGTLNGADLATGTATLSLPGTAKASPNGAFVMAWTQDATIDEIRVGTTYADVTPIPEPASILLLVSGLVGAYKLRRRG